MPKTIVGLDFSGAAIRAVEVANPDAPQPTIVRVAEVAAPADSVNRGEVLEPNTVATALKQLWSLGGFRSKRVVIGMGNQRVLSRDLTVPRAPMPQIRESLPFQVQDMLPVPVNDAILDFYPIADGIGESGPVVHGLLVAAVKDAVLANVRAVQLAGLNPVGVDLIPFALSRSLVRNQRRSGTVALVELGGDTSSVVVVTEGVPQFVRIIPVGGNDVTRTVADRLEIDQDAAELVKRHLGLGGATRTPDDARAVAVIEESVGEVLASIRNTLNYFVNTRPETSITEIVVSGGAGRLAGLVQAIEAATRIPTVIGDPFVGVGLSRSISDDLLEYRGPAITTAFSLALGSAA
jgi:type IV pilus assembly protein PilM